ncbi:FecR family protein [Pedobacter heparinus]|uniref:FecR protein n=1 Tax=Pedobacter heparinus (strain ATCC 13125 / DSM 2366 / CIP 104194 / JCM 7457 / NBRC 12017 / NCIMB 9290 / NRRL B-14731 / HIM 762-3) TaxID=485917 RepID=C6XTS9_PEDHD|nr:FecR family protein [Pedobacter heparinus]ACU03715.1 FecR protein [Pedobacter heparinus DSM 2366]
MENKNADQLLKKYLEGTCTPDEKAIIESWYEKETQNRIALPGNDTDLASLEDEIWTELQKRTKKQSRPVWYPYAAAAAVIALIFSVLHFVDFGSLKSSETIFSQNKIAPGANKALLVLADGSEIDLSDAKSGLLSKQAGVRIKKAADGQLVYELLPTASEVSPGSYNTLVTPKGGQFQVNLPDGTRVWLNASSSIKFPTIFNRNERLVEVTGEAYFEVSKNRQLPFKVQTASQLIEVLGTHFNVNAYADEESTKTTLLEGSVKVSQAGGSSGIILKPGEQSILLKGTFSTTSVQQEEAIAWKNGYFQFSGEDIGMIMRKIARWYNVEIVYHKDFVNQRFSGTISRFEEVSKVLRMLELTGSVHFKTEGRRIVVMP